MSLLFWQRTWASPEAVHAVEAGANGVIVTNRISLFNRNTLPNEDEQYGII